MGGGDGGGHEWRFSRQTFPVISAGGCQEQFWLGKECPFWVTSQHCLSSVCWPQGHTSYKVPCRTVLGRLLWDATFPNHACFFSISWQLPERVPVQLDLALHPVLCSKKEMWRRFLMYLVLKSWIFFSVSKLGPMSHSHRDGDDKSLVHVELWSWRRLLNTVAPRYLELVTSSNFWIQHQ